MDDTSRPHEFVKGKALYEFHCKNCFAARYMPDWREAFMVTAHAGYVVMVEKMAEEGCRGFDPDLAKRILTFKQDSSTLQG